MRAEGVDGGLVGEAKFGGTTYADGGLPLPASPARGGGVGVASIVCGEGLVRRRMRAEPTRLRWPAMWILLVGFMSRVPLSELVIRYLRVWDSNTINNFCNAAWKRGRDS